ncbi:alpha/beta hydrolase [Candidatus Saccharibacteria bacterium]|nr:alpha/beta hydrolase [Candidatus Saccharibacteria bacterium]MBP9131600.1 alpha/beta hydrolase [Candidatus Saccharibacteria bacterium]
MKIYILHGWAYSTEKWQPFLLALKDRKIDSKMLYIPGLTDELDEAWDIDNYIKWLAETLPNEPVILLGHSNGGRLALNYAYVYPDRVKQLILLDSAGIYHGGLARIKRNVFKKTAKLGKKITKSEGAKKVLYKLARVSDYKEAPEHMKITMQNMIDSDKGLSLSEIQNKTNIIWGGMDKITPLTDGVQMHRQIADSSFKVVDDARHSPQFTHVDEVADIVTRALR